MIVRVVCKSVSRFVVPITSENGKIKYNIVFSPSTRFKHDPFSKPDIITEEIIFTCNKETSDAYEVGRTYEFSVSV